MSLDKADAVTAQDEVVALEQIYTAADLEALPVHEAALENAPAVAGRVKKNIYVDCVAYRQPCDIHKNPPGQPVGTLRKGVHFFDVQQSFRPAVSHGKYRNTYWMKVSGKDWWVSAVFCSEGGNDQKIPGLQVRSPEIRCK